ncbi:MAG TPA: hypothetical protein VFQ65_29935 [Kofleriaceae bacterium]|nr:hypothetical protein [Kofleriaceae bacterium]
MRALVIGVGFCLIACQKPAATGDDQGIDAPASTGSDSGIPADFQMLISRSWTMPTDTEGYKCVRVQVPSDMWITAFRSLSPIGTHHSVLTISTSSSQTGEYDCSAGSLDNQMLYAAGVGTDDNAFPPGVAIHLTAGTYINLNLHLYNTTDNSITATSGVLVKTIDAAAVVHEADMQFSGTFLINVPSDNQVHTAAGSCMVANDFHVFTLWPHMHQTAIHQTLAITHSGSTSMMLDTDYAFAEQKNYPMVDTVIHAGDKITTTCSYQNNTGSAMTFGESSNNEMCFTGIYRYPAGGNLFACAMGGSI